MTGTDIAVHEPQVGTLALSGDQIEWSPVQQAALAHIGIAEAPQADQQVFMHICQQHRLDPFARQIYMIPRREKVDGEWRIKWSIQTGIDGFRLIAERHDEYAGTLDPEWCGTDGVWREAWVDRMPPVAARVKVLRRDRPHPITLPVRFVEFAATFQDGNLQGQWKSKPAHMIGKVAEAAALRKAFPQELSGLYTDDEMAAGPAIRGAAPARGESHAVTSAELTGAVIDAEPEPDRGPTPPGDPDAKSAEVPATKTSAPGKTRASAGAAQTPADPTPPTGPPAEAPATEPDGPAPDGVELADQKQHRAMHKLWREADVTEREERLLVTQLLLGRVVDTSKDLTPTDADEVIGGLNRLVRERRKPLADAVNDLLQEYAARAGEQLEEPDPRDEHAADAEQGAADDDARGES